MLARRRIPRDGPGPVISGEYDPIQEDSPAIDMYADFGTEVSDGVPASDGDALLNWYDNYQAIQFWQSGVGFRPLLDEVTPELNNQRSVDLNPGTNRRMISKISHPAQGIIPAATGMTIYLWGSCTTLFNSLANSVFDSELGRTWVTLNNHNAPYGQVCYDGLYRPATAQISTGSHCWIFHLPSGGPYEYFQDGASLGNPITTVAGQGVGGILAIGAIYTQTIAFYRGKWGRMMVFGAAHSVAAMARAMAWGSAKYGTP